MPTTYSSLLRLTLQDVGENPDTWGLILNASVFEMLEDAVAGMVSVSVTSGDATLTTANGSTDQARNMIVEITGSPGAARNVNVPALTKVYLANNKTTGGQTITIKTPSGTGISLIANTPTWVYCDGTNVLAGNLFASTSATCTGSAADSASLGGFAAALYARLAVAQNFTKAQAATTVTLTDAATIAIDASLSNKFRVVLGGNRTLGDPTNTLVGQSFSVLVVQDATGSRTLAYGSKYKWAASVTPTLTTTASRADMLYFDYDSVSDKYLGSVLQNYAI